MSTFATELASRLRTHDAFWLDYKEIRALGAHKSLRSSSEMETSPLQESTLHRLIFCASVFAQSDEESDLAIAQAIALSALFVSKQKSVFESVTSVLAQIGNFPGVKFIQNNVQHEISSPINELQLHLLETLNTVDGFGASRALTDFQLKTWYSLPSLRTASISAPTSAGKSFVVIEYLCQQVIERDQFVGVYVTPTRALLGEVHKKLSEKLAHVEGLRVSTVPAVDPEHRSKQLFILTQERLSALLSLSSIKPEILIVDEAQNIADGARGMILQDCIERIRDRNPNAQVLLLSPSATGFSEVMSTLGIDNTSQRETLLSPVLQNRIVVHAVPTDPHKLKLSLLEKGEQTDLGEIVTSRGMHSADTRLAAVALELGSEGATLVYATGPAESEKIAARLVLGLQKTPSKELLDLSDFIKAHIHHDYGLAEIVLYGVAFHYGKMPSLLREAIELAFQEGHIKYLVCTTTLFQGVNLPARNVFINTPTRGRGVQLDPALLWNFAGRAGRLSKDVVGNVFLVDYNSWAGSPLDQLVSLQVFPAFAKTVSENVSKIVGALSGEMPKDVRGDERPAEIRAAAGYLLSRASSGSVKKVLDRLPRLLEEDRLTIGKAADRGILTLGLSTHILESNWTVDPFGLARLRDKLALLTAQGLIDDLVPCDPSDSRAFGTYAGIFNLIAREVLQWNAERLGAFVANYALQWMRGTPYPVLIAKWIKNKQKNGGGKKIDPLIRGAFDFIEDELRFKWVQQGKAYIDVLDQVLKNSNKDELRASIYDFSLALELGVSTRTGRSFIELGLSRIAAATLASLYPDSDLSVDTAREALIALDVSILSLSPVIIRELEELQLERPGDSNGS